jgi:hypothetical protein
MTSLTHPLHDPPCRDCELPEYKLRNSFPPTFVRVIKMTDSHVIFLYSDNRSSLIDRDSFDRFYEEV